MELLNSLIKLSALSNGNRNNHYQETHFMEFVHKISAYNDCRSTLSSFETGSSHSDSTIHTYFHALQVSAALMLQIITG